MELGTHTYGLCQTSLMPLDYLANRKKLLKYYSGNVVNHPKVVTAPMDCSRKS
jgi:hypothetical protein